MPSLQNSPPGSVEGAPTPMLRIEIPNLEALPQAAEQFLAYLEGAQTPIPPSTPSTGVISPSLTGEGWRGAEGSRDGERLGVSGVSGVSRSLAFLAPMGTGKTTFISALCEALGVDDVVNSPTFAIVNEYYSRRWQEPVYHFDFYRLRSLDEARAIGLEDYLSSGHLCLMEWPEVIEPLLPDDTLVVRLTENPDGSRTLEAQ